MLGPRSLFSPNCYKTGSTVSDAGVTVIIRRRSYSTVARSTIASAIIPCIVIRGIIRTAPATIVQGLAVGGFAVAPMMAAAIVIRFMVSWIIRTATIHPV